MFQCPQATAEVLMAAGYECEERGEIKVKGKAKPMITYFVIGKSWPNFQPIKLGYLYIFYIRNIYKYVITQCITFIRVDYCVQEILVKLIQIIGWFMSVFLWCNNIIMKGVSLGCMYAAWEQLVLKVFSRPYNEHCHVYMLICFTCHNPKWSQLWPYKNGFIISLSTSAIMNQ